MEQLAELDTKGQFLWNQQVLVHAMISGMKEPFATVATKKVDALGLSLRSPLQQVSLGRIAELGHERKIELDRDGWDILRFEFKSSDQVHSQEFSSFLQEHYQLVKDFLAGSEN